MYLKNDNSNKKSLSTSTLKKLKCFSTIFSEELRESFTVYFLLVNGIILRTRNWLAYR